MDGENGRDWKDGATEATALKTLQRAAKIVKDELLDLHHPYYQ